MTLTNRGRDLAANVADMIAAGEVSDTTVHSHPLWAALAKFWRPDTGSRVSPPVYRSVWMSFDEWTERDTSISPEGVAAQADLRVNEVREALRALRTVRLVGQNGGYWRPDWDLAHSEPVAVAVLDWAHHNLLGLATRYSPDEFLVVRLGARDRQRERWSS